MNWTELDTWILLTGALTAMACALPGLFLILTRQSLLGDGISHAILPGLAIAFIIAGTRSPLVMLAGAVAAGVLTALLTRWIQRVGQVEDGAALGVAFCTLFALGLLLIRVAADHVDIDPDCVLYGSLELAVIDHRAVPFVVWQAAGLLLFNLGIMALFHKQLTLAAFDPGLAASQGIPAERVRLGITVLTSMTVVLAFESVGSILVIAMLIVPGAIALVLSRRLPAVILITLLAAAFSGAFGHLSAITWTPRLLAAIFPSGGTGAVSSSGMMVVAGGILLAGVLLGKGLLARGVNPST